MDKEGSVLINEKLICGENHTKILSSNWRDKTWTLLLAVP